MLTRRLHLRLGPVLGAGWAPASFHDLVLRSRRTALTFGLLLRLGVPHLRSARTGLVFVIAVLASTLMDRACVEANQNLAAV
jgi:hypothetical protein